MKFKDETRGGLPFTLYTPNAGGDRPVHGKIVTESGEVMVRDWFANGGYSHALLPHPYDLIPLREPSEAAVEAANNAYWVNPPIVPHPALRAALRAAYEIDFPEGGK